MQREKSIKLKWYQKYLKYRNHSTAENRLYKPLKMVKYSVSYEHCTMHIALCTLHYTNCTAHYTLHITLYTLHFAHCTMHIALCTLHYEHCTMHIALCILQYGHCTMHYILWTLHYAQCTIHIVLCTLYSDAKMKMCCKLHNLRIGWLTSKQTEWHCHFLSCLSQL